MEKEKELPPEYVDSYPFYLNRATARVRRVVEIMSGLRDDHKEIYFMYSESDFWDQREEFERLLKEERDSGKTINRSVVFEDHQAREKLRNLVLISDFSGVYDMMTHYGFKPGTTFDNWNNLHHLENRKVSKNMRV
jgi:hypothetical protein